MIDRSIRVPWPERCICMCAMTWKMHLYVCHDSNDTSMCVPSILNKSLESWHTCRCIRWIPNKSLENTKQMTRMIHLYVCAMTRMIHLCVCHDSENSARTQEVRPRMEKSHSKRHELSFCGLFSILGILITPQKPNYTLLVEFIGSSLLVQLNFYTKMTKILYYMYLLLGSFYFVETYFTTHPRFVAYKSAISPFLGGSDGDIPCVMKWIPKYRSK